MSDNIRWYIKLVGDDEDEGKNYHITKDPQFLAISPVLTSILGIKKAVTYNAITAVK